ncbi:MAG: STAS domain-containing protein [Planctomycetia bacterium]|jgi:anti-anti-sigma factor
MQIHDQGGEPRALILEGRLDSESAAALEASIAKALEDAPGELRLVMAAVDYLSSAGLRELVRGHKLATAKGARFGASQASDRVRSVLKVAGLSHLLLD